MALRGFADQRSSAAFCRPDRGGISEPRCAVECLFDSGGDAGLSGCSQADSPQVRHPVLPSALDDHQTADQGKPSAAHSRSEVFQTAVYAAYLRTG